MMRERMKLYTVLALVACACSAESDPVDDADAGPDQSELEGAGGRDLLQDWPSIDIPFSENAKMLNFEMLRNEVLRATGRSWVVSGVDQWEANRTVLGGADFVQTWYYDTTPNQQKIVTIRKMAFTVCQDVITAEAGQTARTIFTELDPGLTIDVGAEATTAQVNAIYTRFFLEAPSDVEVTDSLALLGDLQTLRNPRTAWRGLCAGFLASMRFLTY